MSRIEWILSVIYGLLPLCDIEDFGCCGVLAGPLDGFTMLTLAARNIALAEAKGLDIMTLCNGCFGTLSKAVHQLENHETRNKVNAVLKEIGPEVRGSAHVHHFHQVLYDTIGLDEIKKRNKVDVSECRIGCHNGCHLVKPRDVLHFDQATYPRKLEEMVQATSARVVTPQGFEH